MLKPDEVPTKTKIAVIITGARLFPEYAGLCRTILDKLSVEAKLRFALPPTSETPPALDR